MKTINPTPSATALFWSKSSPDPDCACQPCAQAVSLADRCLIWRGAMTADGYGRAWDGEQNVSAHRMAYALRIGPVPEGMQLDHLCRVRACVNPAHLEPVTCQENLLRGQTHNARNAVKTHCDSGHAFTPENTRFTAPSKRYPNGRRTCRACHRAWVRDWRARQRAEGRAA